MWSLRESGDRKLLNDGCLIRTEAVRETACNDLADAENLRDWAIAASRWRTATHFWATTLQAPASLAGTSLEGKNFPSNEKSDPEIACLAPPLKAQIRSPFLANTWDFPIWGGRSEIHRKTTSTPVQDDPGATFGRAHRPSC
jgi:hypothetical protein